MVKKKIRNIGEHDEKYTSKVTDLRGKPRESEDVSSNNNPKVTAIPHLVTNKGNKTTEILLM